VQLASFASRLMYTSAMKTRHNLGHFQDTLNTIATRCNNLLGPHCVFEFCSHVLVDIIRFNFCITVEHVATGRNWQELYLYNYLYNAVYYMGVKPGLSHYEKNTD
jgi:hypothetical protein